MIKTANPISAIPISPKFAFITGETFVVFPKVEPDVAGPP